MWVYGEGVELLIVSLLRTMFYACNNRSSHNNSVFIFLLLIPSFHLVLNVPEIKAKDQRFLT